MSSHITQKMDAPHPAAAVGEQYALLDSCMKQMNGQTAIRLSAIAARLDGEKAMCWFVASAGTVLTTTGIAKVWSAFGQAKLLAVADPITGIKFGPLLLAVGIAEILIALVCFFSKRQTLALGLVCWLATNFLVYRLGLWWMGWHRPCSCLGSLTDALHISPQLADNIMKVVLAYLLLGSYCLLAWQWRRKQDHVRNQEVCKT